MKTSARKQAARLPREDAQTAINVTAAASPEQSCSKTGYPSLGLNPAQITTGIAPKGCYREKEPVLPEHKTAASPLQWMQQGLFLTSSRHPALADPLTMGLMCG